MASDDPKPTLSPPNIPARSPSARLHRLWVALASTSVLTFGLICCTFPSLFINPLSTTVLPPPHAANILSMCSQLNAQPSPPADFYERDQSDRFEKGTRPVLVRNARIWTGEKNGTEVLRGMDILLDGGIIQAIGHLGYLLERSPKLLNLEVVEADGRWVTPGIIDVHSHMGPKSVPELRGSDGVNSEKGNIQPWLRILDALNTHDEAYQLTSAGGVTTSLVLPGSADAIGGQAIVVKLRATSDRSSSAMVLEPPQTVNASFTDPTLPLRWRHIKHACGAGENPSDVYQGTRMDTYWDIRQGYIEAKKIKDAQDAYCARAIGGDWLGLGDFPQDLKWEALVDVLRGRTKVNVHCYEAVDIDAFVRLSNEFKFPVAAFHHASEAYLIPDRVKQSYGQPPAIALFAVLGGYKRESYRASEFAPRILAEHNITVLLKSDHPNAVNARYLVHEAQQAYFYGFPENLALLSVISNPAVSLGMGHRIGYIKQGYDADLVVWDSHPLALGATPVQVFVDGLAQIREAAVVVKPRAFQSAPKVPDFDDEARKAVEFEGLPDISIGNEAPEAVTIFTNVNWVHVVQNGVVQQLVSATPAADNSTVVVREGTIVCYGSRDACSDSITGSENSTIIDLDGGSIAPGLVSYGCGLGLEEIVLAPSTTDGKLFDPLDANPPPIIGGSSSIIRAVDGLQFGTRHALQAYRAGVTTGITSPITSSNFLSGLGVYFSLGAKHKLERGAIGQDVTAVHVSITHSGNPGVSTQIAVLRRLLLKPSDGELGLWFAQVQQGKIPLVVQAHSADIIATLIKLKKDVEAEFRSQMRLTVTGATEAHLLARELAEANVGVILSPPRPFPHTWDQRRILPGPPLSNNSAVMELVGNGVVVGLGCQGKWSATARNLAFDIGWAAIESGGRLSKDEAIALGSSNVRKLLGVDVSENDIDMIASRGGDLVDFGSKVVAVFSSKDGKLRLL